jgi:hypothetical protein
MNDFLIQRLVIRACKYGAQGIRVLGWTAPQSASDDPEGKLVITNPPSVTSATQKAWYE